jgi:hypothetical protein
VSVIVIYAEKVRFLQEAGRKAVHEFTKDTKKETNSGEGVEGGAAERSLLRLTIN